MDDFLTAAQIRDEATKRGISIAALCRAAGVSQTTFYRWEDGGDLKVGTYQRIRDAAFGRESAA